jgi:hypothetical protein
VGPSTTVLPRCALDREWRGSGRPSAGSCDLPAITAEASQRSAAHRADHHAIFSIVATRRRPELPVAWSSAFRSQRETVCGSSLPECACCLTHVCRNHHRRSYRADSEDSAPAGGATSFDLSQWPIHWDVDTSSPSAPTQAHSRHAELNVLLDRARRSPSASSALGGWVLRRGMRKVRY